MLTPNLSFSLSSWSAWTNDTLTPPNAAEHILHSEIPDVSIIPPLLRRRLNLLGRSCAAQALLHLEKDSEMPIVYCSRHGDIERTLHVLQELVDSDTVSPMHFSLAVHNAVCGVLSIQLNMTSNITAISAGEESLVPTLLEALGILQQGAPQVLCLICDVSLPAVYLAGEAPQPACATGFILGRHAAGTPGAAGPGTNLVLEQIASTGSHAQGDRLSSPLSLIEFLDSRQTSLRLTHNHSVWELSKADAKTVTDA